MRIACLIAGWLTLAGCAARQTPLQIGSPPEDFALELRVRPTTERPGALYILEPDRSLHAAIGGDLGPQFYPPQTRILTRLQTERVYNLLAESGVLGQPSADQPAATTAPFELYVSAGGRRGRVDVNGSAAADLEPLVQELDRLAWVPSERLPATP